MAGMLTARRETPPTLSTVAFARAWMTVPFGCNTSYWLWLAVALTTTFEPSTLGQ